MIHLACQYFLNHDLREKELRTQVRELANAGYECVYGQLKGVGVKRRVMFKWMK